MIITVIGDPGPQGSKRHVGNGRMIESSAKVKPWREAVIWAVRESAFNMITGPVGVAMVFTLKRPASAPKRQTSPHRKPDIDKLCRSTLDALVMAGVIEDDARVVYMMASKVFPDKPSAVPGCFIKIWPFLKPE